MLVLSPLIVQIWLPGLVNVMAPSVIVSDPLFASPLAKVTLAVTVHRRVEIELGGPPMTNLRLLHVNVFGPLPIVAPTLLDRSTLSRDPERGKGWRCHRTARTPRDRRVRSIGGEYIAWCTRLKALPGLSIPVDDCASSWRQNAASISSETETSLFLELAAQGWHHRDFWVS